MRRIVPVLVMVIFLSACKKQSSSTNPCKPETVDTYFEMNRTINASVRSNDLGLDPKPYDYEVKSGNNLLFTFNQQYQDCPDVMDDEGGRLVMIEVPANANSFSIVDNEGDGKILMVNQCFCYDGYPHMISRGKVTGKRISFNRWEIEASLYSSASQTDPVYFKRTFTLKN
jgi:hypothetical protein